MSRFAVTPCGSRTFGGTLGGALRGFLGISAPGGVPFEAGVSASGSLGTLSFGSTLLSRNITSRRRPPRARRTARRVFPPRFSTAASKPRSWSDSRASAPRRPKTRPAPRPCPVRRGSWPLVPGTDARRPPIRYVGHTNATPGRRGWPRIASPSFAGRRGVGRPERLSGAATRYGSGEQTEKLSRRLGTLDLFGLRGPASQTLPIPRPTSRGGGPRRWRRGLGEVEQVAQSDR